MQKKLYNYFYTTVKWAIILTTSLHLSSCSDDPVSANLQPADGTTENSLKAEITATFSKEITVPNDWSLSFTVKGANSTKNICTSYLWDTDLFTVTCLHDELLNETSYTSQISNIENVTNNSATFTTISGQGIGWATGLMFGGYGTIIFTNNGGETWTRQGNATQIPNISITDVGIYNSLTAWAVGENDGNLVILKTSDSGSTWERQGTTLELSSTLFGVSVLDSNTVWVAGRDSTILFTNDSGQNWTEMNNGVPNNIEFRAITATDENHVWAAGKNEIDNHPVILRTDNGGITWIQQELPLGTHPDFYPIDISSSSPNNALCVGERDSLITSNGGTNWIESYPSPVHINGAYALDENNLWMAADYGVIYYTIDGGYTWNEAEVPGSAGGIAMMGIFFQGNGTNGWAVGSLLAAPPKMGILLRSSDGGKNWTEQTSPVNVMYRRVAFVGKQK
jgi:photosystem II stability/assembly factor-like uncharacterized protein